MTTATRQKIQIPNLTPSMGVNKNGSFNDETFNFFNQLLVSLQYILSTEGVRLPSQVQADLPNLTVPGALIYSSDTNKAWVNLAGTFREIVVI